MSQTIQLVWKGDFRFDGTARGGSITVIDGNSESGTAPVDLMLQSVGACAATDVVDILKKSRQEVQGMAVEVEATRREEPPRYVKRLEFRFRIKGPVDQKKAERAVDLSLEKYCSVFHTFRMDIQLDVEVKIIP
jgi:putative redox protein